MCAGGNSGFDEQDKHGRPTQTVEIDGRVKIMESNPALGLLGFWMMLQLVATLALLIGGIYVLFCLGRAASGLDRLANAMEDWVALQSASSQPMMPPQSAMPPQTGHSFDLSTPTAPIPNAAVVPFTPAPVASAPIRPHTEYSAPDESAR